MSATRGSKKKVDLGYDAGDSMKKATGTEKEKKKKFSLPQPTRKIWEVFRHDTEKRASLEDSGRGSSFYGPAGVSEAGHLSGNRQEKLELFESNNFDVEDFTNDFVVHLTEKGVNTLRGDLATLQEQCEEEVHHVIHGQYPAFVTACEGVEELGVQFQQLRALIAGSSTLVNDLKRVSQSAVSKVESNENASNQPLIASSKQQNAVLDTALEELGVAIAERDFRAVTKLLRAAEDALVEASPRTMATAEYVIQKHREKLVSLLENLLGDPTLAVAEQHSLLRVLAGAVGDVHALRLMLLMHSHQLRVMEHQLLKPQRAGDSDPDGTDYVGSLSQCLFHTLSRAMEDSQAVFPSPQPGLHCIFVVWARKETVHCCNLIKEHALSALAGPSGLAPTVHCVCLAIIYAMLLEEGHQLSLVNLVRRELWSYIEGVLDHHFRAIADSISAHVREELDTLVSSPTAWSASPTPSPASNTLYLSSAARLLSEIEAVANLLSPIGHPSLQKSLLKGIDCAFLSFTTALERGLKDQLNNTLITTSLEGILDSVALMVEELIPQALSRLENTTGCIPGTEFLQKYVDNLAMALGMQEIDE